MVIIKVSNNIIINKKLVVLREKYLNYKIFISEDACQY